MNLILKLIFNLISIKLKIKTQFNSKQKLNHFNPSFYLNINFIINHWIFQLFFVLQSLKLQDP